MKITIFGSTGRTGQQLVSQALERGHQVHAAARSPEKMTLRHDALEVIACDVFSPETLEAAVSEADAVIVSLTGPDQTRSRGTANILRAMKAQGVPQILIVSTIGVGESINQLSVAGKMFVRTIIAKAVEDHARQEQAVIESGLRWTIARPGGLSSRGRSETYQADPDGIIRVSQISRADVAHFLLDALEDGGCNGKIYALSA